MLLSSACCDLKNSKVHFGATTTARVAAAAVASKLLKGRFVCAGSCKLQAATGAHNEAACVARKPSSQAAKTVRLSDYQTARQPDHRIVGQPSRLPVTLTLTLTLMVTVKPDEIEDSKWQLGMCRMKLNTGTERMMQNENENEHDQEHELSWTKLNWFVALLSHSACRSRSSWDGDGANVCVNLRPICWPSNERRNFACD